MSKALFHANDRSLPDEWLVRAESLFVTITILTPIIGWADDVLVVIGAAVAALSACSVLKSIDE